MLVWAIPEMPNGVIKSYEIRMIGEGASENVAVVDAVTFYFEPVLEDLPHGSNITVQASAGDDGFSKCTREHENWMFNTWHLFALS